jgi:hypothetical protein
MQQTVSHREQASTADLIPAAGRSPGLHQTLLENPCFCGTCSTAPDRSVDLGRWSTRGSTDDDGEAIY